MSSATASYKDSLTIMKSLVSMLLWFISICLFLVFSSAAVGDTKSSKNDEVRNKIEDVKQQVNLMFEKAKQRADARKKTGTIEMVKEIAKASSESAEVKKHMNSQDTMDASLRRNASIRIQEIDVRGPSDGAQVSSSSRASTSSQRMQRTLDAHAIPLAQQREIVGMTAANIPRHHIINHLKSTILSGMASEHTTAANDIIIASNIAHGFAVPKESVDTIKARELQLAKNMEKFKKAKAAFAKLKG